MSGVGVPSDAQGANGDTYLDGATGDLYEKASGSWGSPFANLKGPEGSPGSGGDGGSVLDDAPWPTNLRIIGTRALSPNGGQLSNGTVTGQNSHVLCAFPLGANRFLVEYLNYQGSTNNVPADKLVSPGTTYDQANPYTIYVRCAAGRTTTGAVPVRGQWIAKETSPVSYPNPSGPAVYSPETRIVLINNPPSSSLDGAAGELAIGPGERAWAVVDIDAAVDEKLWLNTFVRVTSGDRFPQHIPLDRLRGEGVSESSGETDKSLVAAPAGVDWNLSGSLDAFYPVCVRALDPPPQPARRARIALLTDSIGAGPNYPIDLRLKEDTHPHVRIGRATEALSTLLNPTNYTQSMFRWRTIRGGFDAALIQYGTNDLTNQVNFTLPILQARIREIIAFAKRRGADKIGLCTLPPTAKWIGDPANKVDRTITVAGGSKVITVSDTTAIKVGGMVWPIPGVFSNGSTVQSIGSGTVTVADNAESSANNAAATFDTVVKFGSHAGQALNLDAGQRGINEAIRLAFNTWARGGSPISGHPNVLDGAHIAPGVLVLDTGGALESIGPSARGTDNPQQIGRWKVDNTGQPSTTDTLHPGGPAAYALAGPYLDLYALDPS